MTASTSRWLTWTPTKIVGTIEKGPEMGPSEPSKPGSGGFGSPSWGVLPMIDGAGPKTPLSADLVSGKLDPLWGDPCPCGSREWWKMRGPVLECKACGRSVRSEYLATGGRP